MRSVIEYQFLTERNNFEFNQDGEEDNYCCQFILCNEMNNPYGFQDGRSYKIVCSLDNRVVEIVENELRTGPEDPAREDSQIFHCRVTESGYYELRSQQQSKETTPLVWDYNISRKRLIQRKQNVEAARSTQAWNSEIVPGAVASYFIISASPSDTPLCLKGSGNGKQIRVVPKSAEIIADKSAHWKLVMTEPGAAKSAGDQKEVKSTAAKSKARASSSPPPVRQKKCVIF